MTQYLSVNPLMGKGKWPFAPHRLTINLPLPRHPINPLGDIYANAAEPIETNG